MKKVALGIIAMLGGVASFIIGIQYGWLSDANPSLPKELYDRYRLLSELFGYFSFMLIIGGGLILYFSIRRMNAEYREELKKLKSAPND